MFGRKKKAEVFMTNDLGLYTTVHQALKAGQIPCEVKVVNTGTGTGGPAHSSAG